MWGIVDTMGLLMGIGRLAAPALGTGSADDEEERRRSLISKLNFVKNNHNIYYNVNVLNKSTQL